MYWYILGFIVTCNLTYQMHQLCRYGLWPMKTIKVWSLKFEKSFVVHSAKCIKEEFNWHTAQANMGGHTKIMRKKSILDQTAPIFVLFWQYLWILPHILNFPWLTLLSVSRRNLIDTHPRWTCFQNMSISVIDQMTPVWSHFWQTLVNILNLH